MCKRNKQQHLSTSSSAGTKCFMLFLSTSMALEGKIYRGSTTFPVDCLMGEQIGKFCRSQQLRPGVTSDKMDGKNAEEKGSFDGQ